MSIGALLAGLLSGQQDPRAQLLQQVAAQGGDRTPAGMAAAAATTAPGQGQQPPPVPAQQGQKQPDATASPPDLSSLYMKLMQQDRQAAAIDRGLTTLAAGFAKPGNREALLRTAGGYGRGGGGGADDYVSSLMEIQKFQQAQAANAAALAMKNNLRGRLPAIARQYGMDIDTVTMLFEQGKLEDTLKTLAVPDTEIRQLGDGRTVVVNKRSGKPISDLGGAAPREMKILEGNDGEKFAYDPTDPTKRTPMVDPKVKLGTAATPGGGLVGFDPYTGEKRADIVAGQPKTMTVERSDGSKYLANEQTGEPIKELSPPKAKTYSAVTTGEGGITAFDPNDPTKSIDVRQPGPKTTTDLTELTRVNEERAKAGQPPIPAEQWLKDMASTKAPKTSVDISGNKIAEGFAKTYVDDFAAAQSGHSIIANIDNARNALNKGIVAGNWLAPGVSEIRKVAASAFGLPDEAANNTDRFRSAMNEIVLPKVKALGTGNSISNADVEFIANAVGSNTMDPSTIRQILNIMEKGARNQMVQYNRSIDALARDNPDGAKFARRIQLPAPKNVPAAAISFLRDNKDDATAIAEFEDKYGLDTAQHFLGGN